MKSINDFCKNWLPAIKPEHHNQFIQDVAALLKPPDNAVWVESTVNRDFDPLITARMGTYSFQVAPEEARRIGRSFEDAATAAELDAFVYRFFAKIGLPQEGATAMVVELRAYRETREIEEMRRWRERENK